MNSTLGNAPLCLWQCFYIKFYIKLFFFISFILFVDQVSHKIVLIFLFILLVDQVGHKICCLLILVLSLDVKETNCGNQLSDRRRFVSIYFWFSGVDWQSIPWIFGEVEGSCHIRLLGKWPLPQTFRTQQVNLHQKKMDILRKSLGNLGLWPTPHSYFWLFFR